MKGRNVNKYLKWQDNRKVNSFVAMLVPLYLVMLAFFVILCSISTPVDSKKKDVLDSLKGHFKEFPYHEKEHGSLPQRLDMVKKLFSQSSLPGSPEPIIESDSIRIPIQLIKLYEPGSGTFKQSRHVFFLKLVSQILNQQPKFKLRCLIGFRKMTPNKEALAIQQAGNLAHFLLSNGAPLGTIEVGVSADESGTIQFIFEPLEEEKSNGLI